jgi:hypothetical protein
MTAASSSTVMLVGLPRSGTTWLGKIFDSHPDTFYSHEPDSANLLADVPLLPEVASSDRYRQALIDGVKRFRRLRTISVVGKMPLFPKSYGSWMPPGLRARELLLLKALARGLGEIQVPRHVSGDPADAPVWVWKSIESTGRLGMLARTFPAAKIIFIIRHPCGVAASVFRGSEGQKFDAAPPGEDIGFFRHLAETKQAKSRGLTLERFREMSPVERVAWRWALINEKALEDISGLGNCKVFRYEDLCEQPTERARELFAFAGLDWNSQTEAFVSNSTESEDRSYFGVFKDPRKAAYKWKEQLPSEISGPIRRITSQTLPGQLFG